LWTSRSANFSDSGVDQLGEVALHVLALPATQTHQERINKHLHRIIRACGARLGDETEYARLILGRARICTPPCTSSPALETRLAVISVPVGLPAAHPLWF
jgi:hypothetical protein